MQPSPIRDFVVGLFVLAGLAALAYLSIQVGGLSYKGPGGLELIASFDEIGGLATRAPVAISGVKVGQVSRIELDPALRARVTLDVDRSLKLPIDSTASIRTSGLLGDQFVAVEPGAEEQMLKSGEELEFTESALSIERLIGKFVNNAGLDSEDKDKEKK
jgi:phospholipid/cholesterol/gamma-HCH transport system substrate-binding protein